TPGASGSTGARRPDVQAGVREQETPSPAERSRPAHRETRQRVRLYPPSEGDHMAIRRSENGIRSAAASTRKAVNPNLWLFGVGVACLLAPGIVASPAGWTAAADSIPGLAPSVEVKFSVDPDKVLVPLSGGQKVLALRPFPNLTVDEPAAMTLQFLDDE